MYYWLLHLLLGLIAIAIAFDIAINRIKRNPERALEIAKRLGVRL